MYLVSIIIINFKEGTKGHFQNWDCRDLKSPELELELKSLELELELELKLFVSSGIGIGIGIENNGIGIELKKWNWPQPWLDDQSEHHGQRFAQTSRHAGVHGLRWSGEDGSVFVRSISGPPQHGARGPGTGPTGFKFHSGSVRDGMVVIPSSPARSTPRHQGTEVTLFTDASSSSWGAS